VLNLLRTLKPILTLRNLKLIYFSYIHSIITHGIIFGGNSTASNEVFKLQKRAIRIIQILKAGPHVAAYLKS